MLITNSCQSPLHFQVRFNSSSIFIAEASVQEEECVTHAKPKSFAENLFSFPFVQMPAKRGGECSLPRSGV